MKVACCLFSYGITKGMKSFGPIGLLKKNQYSKELILQQIDHLRQIFGPTDIYIITGFGEDKLYKKISHKKYITTISNPEYNNRNYGYATRLFMENIKDKLKDYHGIFFMDSNILIKNLSYKKKNHSWVVAQKHRQHKNNKNDFLGLTIDSDNTLRYLFYNMGNIGWCKSFYLTSSDIQTMIKHENLYHDNMFLFEIINTCIEKLDLKLTVSNVDNSKDCIEIKGIKDKYKIQ